MKVTINIDGKKIAEQILGGNAAGEEKGYLLYVELPNLINRIIKLAVGQTPDEGMARIFAEEIKKVSNAELESALNTVKMLGKPSEKTPQDVRDLGDLKGFESITSINKDGISITSESN